MGLEGPGRKLWDAIVSEFVLRDDERAILGAACRTVNELSVLEQALAAAETLVEGSTGQPRANPLYSEVRAHRLALKGLLGGLGLADVDAAGSVTALAGAARSTAGRRLARERWGTRGAA